MKRIFEPDGILPLTPAPQQREALLGYLLRVSERNGYDTPWHVLVHAGLDAQQFLKSIPDTEPFAKVLMQTKDVLDRLPWRHWPSGADIPIGNEGHKTVLHLVDWKRPKICPDCIRENGIADAAWDLKVMVACPVHRRPLITTCPACLKRLTWFRPGLARCRCGHHLKASDAAAISAPAAALLTLISNVIHGAPVALESDYGIPVSDLARLDARDLLVLMNRVRENVLPDDRRKVIQAFTVDELEAVAAFFADWPKGCHAALKHIQSLNPSENESAALGITKHFEALYEALKRSRIGREKLEFLYRAIAEYGIAEWSGVFVDTRVLDRLDIERDQRKVGGIADLARRMGVRLITARGWVDDGVVPAREIKQGDSQRTVVDLTSDLPVKMLDGAMGDRDAGRYLGLPVRVLSVLRQKKVYKVRHLGLSLAQYHRLDLDALRTELMSLAPTRLELVGDGQSTVTELMRRKFKTEAAKAAILVAVGDGRLKPAGCLGDQIGDIVLDTKAALAVSLEQRTACSDWLPTSQAAKLLNCDPTTIPELVKLGHLRGRQKTRVFDIEVASIRMFSEKYVPLAVLAESMGAGVRRLTRVLTKAGVDLLLVKRTHQDSLQAYCPTMDDEGVLHGKPLSDIHRHVLEKLNARLVSAGITLKKPKRTPPPSALQAYLDGLKESHQLLPRRDGKPNLAAIASACGFDRNVFYGNAVVADALAAYEIEEHQRLGATVKLGGVHALQQYLQELRQDNRRMPLRSGKPNRLAIARACGIDRKVLYGNREAVTLLEAFVREQSAIGN